MKNLYKIEDELYVVSNTEGVSENCWIITNDKLVQVSYLLADEVAKGFKVILTTNKLLIKDGVQAIEDDFLEWFVKNPSCEEVEIKKSFHWDNGVYEYEIIIPKEEPTKIYEMPLAINNITKTCTSKPKQDINTCKNFNRETGCDLVDCPCEREKILSNAKQEILQQIDQNNPVTRGSTALVYKQEQKQHLTDMMKDDEKLGLYDYGWCKGNVVLPKEEPFKHKVEVLSKEEILANRSNAYEFIDFDKQETLKEVAENKKNLYYYKQVMNPYPVEEYSHTAYEKGFIEGYQESTKWQMERSYSEEEVLKLILTSSKLPFANDEERIDWFEQFKKK